MPSQPETISPAAQTLIDRFRKRQGTVGILGLGYVGLPLAVVLAEAGKPMNTGNMVRRMLETGLWKTSGKTPSSTIYAAIITEISKKGAASRFRKADRGMFELTEVGKGGN